MLPNKLYVYTRNDIRIPLRIASNLAITINGDRIRFYIRIASISEDFNATSIAYGETSINELVDEVLFKARVVLYPIIPCESVEESRLILLYREVYHVRVYGVDKGAVITFKVFFKDVSSEPISIEPTRFY